MKNILLLAVMTMPFTLSAQQGTWTRNTQETTLTASNDSDFKSFQTKSPSKLGQPVKDELKKQKAIATHQNIEIEGILAENEAQRQEISALKKELNELKQEFQAIKKELLD